MLVTTVPFDLARVVAHVHGHLGWLAVALLVHPAVVLRTRGRARAGIAVGLATGLVSTTAAAGAWLYPVYRERVKGELFASAPTVGWLFERKEHLAFGAVLLAWAGAAAYVGSRRADDEVQRERLHVTSRRAFIAASALAFVTAVLGTIVASYRAL